MNYKAKKIYAGNVSVRDYIVKDAIKKGETLVVQVDGKHMTLHGDRVKDYKATGMVFPVKYGSRERYELYDYVWMPDASLFEGSQDESNN
jgi:hypothetical protein